MIEFWFEFASTYSHIAAQRVEALAKERGIRVVWRPFLLGPIFAAQGWTSSPFNLYPAKGRNMWRDMQRLSARAGLALVKPDPFPANSLLASRIAVQGQDEPWIGDFVRAVYRAQFCEGRNIADAEVLRAVLVALGLPASTLLEGARGEGVKGRLKMQSEHAMRLGIYGAPSFIVAGELFWGNDRLEDALDWAQKPWI